MPPSPEHFSTRIINNNKKVNVQKHKFCLLFGTERRVVRWKWTEVSEEHVASIFKVEE
jgi:hypothetical protein